MPDTDQCVRCHSRAPVQEFVHWEPVSDECSERLGAVCEHCLTREERAALEDDVIEVFEDDLPWLEEDELVC